MNTQTKTTEGTKRNPVKIQVTPVFFVTCPKCCGWTDCGNKDTEVTCGHCGKKFAVEFSLLECGL
jgi:hypothetical protein